MTKKFWMVMPVAMICLSAVAAHAQGGVDQSGCVNSPENPTALLALVGSAGAGVVAMRARWSARRRK